MRSSSSADYTAPKLRAALFQNLLIQEADCMTLATGGAAACGAAASARAVPTLQEQMAAQSCQALEP